MIVIPFAIMNPSHKIQNTPAPQLWNTTPEYIKNADSDTTFKTKLKTFPEWKCFN